MTKNIIKKLCVIILVIGVITGGINISVTAYSGLKTPSYYNSPQPDSTADLSQHVDIDTLRAYLFDAFKSCPGEVSLTQFNIPLSDQEALMSFIWYEMPESFHVYQLGISYFQNKIMSVTAGYYEFADTSEEYLAMLSECDERAAVLLYGITGNAQLSDAEKALLIHDRLAVNCSYDFTFSGLAYNMYGALVNGSAVCDGYSRAYSSLLRCVDVENIRCMSESMCHAWNLVKIDGKYYHVDVTWDDPTVVDGYSHSYEGAVNHDNFLLSNAGIAATGHNASDYYAPATDTGYDDWFWQDSNTEFQLIDGKIYYFDSAEANLMRLNDDGSSGTVLYNAPSLWLTMGGTAYWNGNFSRLSSDGVSLFLSTFDTVYAYNLKSNTATAVFLPELVTDEGIYGFTYSDGYLVCEINDDLNTYDDLRQVKELYVPKNLVFSDVSVTLENSLKVNFKANKALFEKAGYKDPYAVFEFNNAVTAVTEYTVSGNYYVFSYSDIAPDLANDGIKATLCATFGGTVYESAEINISIADYCYALLSMTADTDTELRTLLVDLLHYCAASQAYTGHNANDPADASLTPQQSAWGTTGELTLTSVTNSPNGQLTSPEVRWKAVALSLSDCIAMRFTFSATDTNGLTVKIKNGADGDVLKEYTENDFVFDGQYYLIQFKGIYAAQMSDTVYVTAYRGDEAVSGTLTYSVESYACAKQNDTETPNLSSLVKAMMKYGRSAYIFSHRQEGA